MKTRQLPLEIFLRIVISIVISVVLSIISVKLHSDKRTDPLLKKQIYKTKQDHLDRREKSEVLIEIVENARRRRDTFETGVLNSTLLN